MIYLYAADFPTITMETSADEIKDYFSPKDFMIGKTLYIADRRFFMYGPLRITTTIIIRGLTYSWLSIMCNHLSGAGKYLMQGKCAVGFYLKICQYQFSEFIRVQ